MFEQNKKEKNINEKIDAKFIICYDNFTKSMAISLRNSLGKDEAICVVWSEKVYKENECKLTNRNNLILLNENLIKINLANPNLKHVSFSEGVVIKHERNTLGIYIDPSYKFASFKTTFAESWKKYVTGMVAPILTLGGIPGAIIVTLLLFRSDKAKVKYRLLFDAVNMLKKEVIEKFLQDEKGL